MRLVVDASVLVAEALRVRGRALLAHPRLELFVAAEAWGEAEHELRKRVALVASRSGVTEREAAALRDEALAAVSASVQAIPAHTYLHRVDEALGRLPRDPLDAPTLALALELGCAIWTADRDFFGCGVATWTTETVQWQLRAAEPAADA